MTSKTTVLAVVIGLTLFSLFGLVGAIVLVAIKKDVPEPLWTLVGASVGALASLLASTRSTIGEKEKEPTSVPGFVPSSSSNPNPTPTPIPNPFGPPAGTAPMAGKLPG
jgi:hypothetical protein